MMKAFKRMGEFFEEASTLVEPARELFNCLIAVGSHGDKVKYATYAVTAAAGTNTAAILSLAYTARQGSLFLAQISQDLSSIRGNSDAMVAIEASRFVDQVWNMLRTALEDSPDTWYFIYHPDTIWRYSFAERLRREGPLSREFIGIWNNLDEMVLYMQTIRRDNEKAAQPQRPLFNILMPAYYQIVIEEPLAFPREIRPFQIHCDIHMQGHMVVLNLPEERKRDHINLELYKPPKSLSQLFCKFYPKVWICTIRLKKKVNVMLIGFGIRFYRGREATPSAWYTI